MPTRKVSERERLTLYARQATDDQLEEATEILRIEQRARAAVKAKPAATSGNKKSTGKKAETQVPPGPPNPPKPANDNPVA